MQHAHDFYAVHKWAIEDQIVFKLFDTPLAKVWNFRRKLRARASHQWHYCEFLECLIGREEECFCFVEIVGLFDEVSFFDEIERARGR